jgi:hypothetical protein
MWDAFFRISTTVFLQGQSRPRRFDHSSIRRRNPGRWRRFLGTRCLRFADLRRVKRVPASPTSQRATFLSSNFIITRQPVSGKTPAFRYAGQLQGADPAVVIRPETTPRTLQTVSGVPLDGGQAHRGHDQVRTTFVLTKLTRDGVAHPRVFKEPPCFTYILAYPVIWYRSAQAAGVGIRPADTENAAGAVSVPLVQEGFD